ncbi:M28 family metallopeptidase [Dehalogenimonas alkenigignens]|uniref:Putative aminopeptidase n=1 Tax=Dehalogenimonas alkenigignens TaxID=1217799 RepID=A0A0W0GJT8_9CHLR|nr:M28 family peptidase [Dehalogenimonas alkenigignens]KTB48817.1 putative aminopeptidase [Dehalogenimonas alkenigignens]PVV84776.1 Zn-dependent exopeptidase M28 [Dehalogenimonas alkenigignens]
MITRFPADLARSYLEALCAVKPNRRTGSPGNKSATDFVASLFKQWGYEIDTTPFDCLDYESGAATLTNATSFFPVTISPFSPGINVIAPLAVVSTVKELAACDCTGRLVLLKGEIAAEPLMPKNFAFYNPEQHQQIYALLEAKQPAAIITTTTGSLSTAGAVYPFPMIEDGDFDIPSVYCTEPIGNAIAASGSPLRLVVEARRIPAQAANVVARKNSRAAGKITVCAHLDAKEGTPGALDNASGIAVILLLGEMLADYEGGFGIEFVAVNGEDYYSAGGEMDYLRRYGDSIQEVALAVNIDGAGYRQGKTAFSAYGLPPDLETEVRLIFKRFDGLIEGPPWYQGDHMIFVQAGRPALAFTSEKATDLLSTVTHSAADTPDEVDCCKLVEIAQSLGSLIRHLSTRPETINCIEISEVQE